MGKPRTYEEITSTIQDAKKRRPDQAEYWDGQQAKLDRKRKAALLRVARVLGVWRG